MRGAPRSLEIVLGRADEAEQDKRRCKTGQVLGIDRERNERQEQQVSPHREEKVRGSGAQHYMRLARGAISPFSSPGGMRDQRRMR